MTTEPSARPGRTWWLSATALVCVLAVIRLVLVIVAPYDRAVSLFDDDAFYYFGIARNIATGAGSTFDRLDPTNGYHPLWLLVLVPVFAIWSGHAALVAVTVCSAMLFLVSGLLLDVIGRHVGRPVTVTVAATPLLLLGAAGPSFWFSGMETGVLLCALLAVAAGYVRSDGYRSDAFGPWQALLAGCVVAVAVLARLDGVFPMAVLGAVAVVTWIRAGRRWVRLAVCFGGPVVLCLSVYVAVNRWLFGTSLPVSGQAKALGGNSVNIRVVEQFLTEPTLFGRKTMLGAICLAVLAALVLARPRGTPVVAARFGAVVLAGGVLTVGYYALTSSWNLWPWYFYAAPLAFALMTPVLAGPLADRLPARRLLAGAIVGLVVLTASVNAVRSERGVIRSAYVEAGPAVAAGIDELQPAGVPVAMGDRAGSLGYHLRRPLVHLEGLVNSAEYLDALRTGHVPQFLAARDVGLYVRADADPGVPDPLRAGCRRFEEPAQGSGVKVDISVCDRDLLYEHPIGDGTSYRVWRYRPELDTG